MENEFEDIKRKLESGEITPDGFQALLHKYGVPGLPLPDDIPTIVLNPKNWFGRSCFRHKGNVYHYSNVRAIFTKHVKQSFNLVPSYHADFYLTMSNGEVLRFKARSGIVKTKKPKAIEDASEYIAKATFDIRAKQYTDQLQRNGFFNYHGYEIYADGTLNHKNKSLNISNAGLSGGVEIGRKSEWGLSSYYTPNEIWVTQDVAGKWLPRSICIVLEENRDIIFAIVKQLAEQKGGTIKVAKS